MSSVKNNDVASSNYIDVSRAASGQHCCGAIGDDLKWVSNLHAHTPIKISPAELRDRIMKSNRVKEALNQGRANNRMSKTQSVSYANSILDEMVAAVKPSLIYPLGLAARPFCRNVYRGGININRDGVEQIKKALENGPVILLPIHRSHMDYMAIHFATIANDLPVPFVIAGDNLNFPIIGRLLKKAGAVFIRRSFGADAIYWAVFIEYISQILTAGSLLECFVEGGRSRSGKSIQPKSGFLDVITKLVLEGVIPDVTLVPVGVAYDRMVEGNSFVQEMLGSEKKKESLKGFVHAAASVLQMNLGSIDITVSSSFISLQTYIRQAKYHANEQTERSRLLSSLSHMILYEANRVTFVTASSLVAAVLLTSRTRGITRVAIIDRVAALIADLKQRKAPLSFVIEAQPLPIVVDGAVRMLGRLVTSKNDVICGYWHAESLELGIYRNAAIHWWASDAIVAVALVAVYRKLFYLIDGKSKAGVASQDVLEKVQTVSRLLKAEFIYKPSFNIEDNFGEIINQMTARGQLGTDAGGAIYINGRKGVRYISFLCMLIWPLIDTYWACCTTFLALKPCDIIHEDVLVSMISSRAESSYFKGEMAFYESISTDSIRHALKWFEFKGIIKVQPVITGSKSKQSKLLTLSGDYMPRTDRTPSPLLIEIANSIIEIRAEVPSSNQRPFSLMSRL